MLNLIFQKWRQLAAKRWLLLIAFGILGFLLPLVDAMSTHFPAPRCSDEFAYLLQSYTFLDGKLANTAHPMWEHFQSDYLIHQPAYQAKYPPGQGVFLTLGWLLFGHPAFGVWLSSGLLFAALLWCLYQWVRPRWAVAITVLMLLQFGVRSLWVESYFGGAVEGIGACLLIGGLGMLIKQTNQKTWCALLAIAAGLAILANTRPMEGFVVACCCLLGLIFIIIKNKTWGTVLKHSAPGLVVLLLGLSWVLIYNKATTDSYFTHPQVYYQQQIADSADTAATITNPRGKHIKQPASYPQFMWTFLKNVLSFSAIPTLLLSLLGLPLLMHVKKYRNLLLMLVACIALFIFIYSELNFYAGHVHYYAPLLGAFAVVLAASLQRLYTMPWLSSPLKKMAILSLVILGILQITLLLTNEKEPIHYVSIARAEVEIKLMQTEGKHLVIVQYDDSVDRTFDLVYNTANIDEQSIVWAHHLGGEKNTKLVNYYADRYIWGVTVSTSSDEPAKPFLLRKPAK